MPGVPDKSHDLEAVTSVEGKSAPAEQFLTGGSQQTVGRGAGGQASEGRL